MPAGPPGVKPRRACAAAWAVLLALALLPGAARGQFNGDFSIEKHTLKAENFLDWKAYQHPHPWRYAFYTAPNFLRGTVGSLSQARFRVFHELRLEKELGRYATVRYEQRQDALFRDDPIHQQVEFRLGRTVYASIVGWPASDKREISQGLALAVGEPTDWNFVRLTHLEQFALFNQENKGPERFRPTPKLVRLEFRAFPGERLFVQGDWREERPTRLDSPDPEQPGSGREQTYEGRKLELVVDYHLRPHFLLGLNYSSNREVRTRAPLTPGGAEPRARQRLEWGWLDLYGAFTLDSGDLVEAGGFRARFDNVIHAEAAAERFDHDVGSTALYARWTHPRSTAFQWVFTLLAGPARRRERDGALPELAEDEQSNQVKLGVGVVLRERGSYRVFFQSSWNLDEFDEDQWDGGNVQLLWLF